MKAIIKCPDCNEILGEIEKQSFSASDISKHESMMTCSSGHEVKLFQENQTDLLTPQE